MSISDTGCPEDLIGLADVAFEDKHMMYEAERPVLFDTANDVAGASHQLPSFSKALGVPVNPYIMKHTPPILSVGKRCMKQGYGFWWPPYAPPWYIAPDGSWIAHEVLDDVPYIVNDPQCKVCTPAVAEPAAAEPAAAEPGVSDLALKSNEVPEIPPAPPRAETEEEVEEKVTWKPNLLTHLNCGCNICKIAKQRRKYANRSTKEKVLGPMLGESHL